MTKAYNIEPEYEVEVLYISPHLDKYYNEQVALVLNEKGEHEICPLSHLKFIEV